MNLEEKIKALEELNSGLQAEFRAIDENLRQITKSSNAKMDELNDEFIKNTGKIEQLRELLEEQSGKDKEKIAQVQESLESEVSTAEHKKKTG